jgi:uncharacterized protein YjiS (DUF1127 family)
MRNAASFIASQSAPGSGALHTLYRAASEAVHAWQHRRQISTLVDFDDHMLADIGLSRQDVKEALDLPFSHDPGRELQFRASRRSLRGWNI